MLKLSGNAAAIVHAVKELHTKHPADLRLLQAAIAVTAGVSKLEWVREGDVLRLVAELHDELTRHGLVHRPAEQLVETFLRSLMFDRIHPQPEGATSATTLVREAMVSNIMLVRVRSEFGERLLDWATDLPVDFDASVDALLSADKTPPQVEAAEAAA